MTTSKKMVQGSHIRIDGMVHIVAWYADYFESPSSTGSVAVVKVWRIACDVVLQYKGKRPTRDPLTCYTCSQRAREPAQLASGMLVGQHVITYPPKGNGLVHYAKSGPGNSGHMKFACGETCWYGWMDSVIAPLSCIGCIAEKGS